MKKHKSVNDYEENTPITESGEEEVVQLSEKEQKRLKQREAIEKRKDTRRKDKVARWGGVILLGLIMFVGFLLWVSGEMKDGDSVPTPRYQDQNIVVPSSVKSGSVIVR